jgi:hypothetical protein
LDEQPLSKHTHFHREKKEQIEGRKKSAMKAESQAKGASIRK